MKNFSQYAYNKAKNNFVYEYKDGGSGDLGPVAWQY